MQAQIGLESAGITGNGSYGRVKEERHAALAQPVARKSHNLKVVSSSLTSRTFYKLFDHMCSTLLALGKTVARHHLLRIADVGKRHSISALLGIRLYRRIAITCSL